MSKSSVDALFAPLTFRGGRQANNRLWLAPLTNQSSHEDGSLSNDELRFLTARAAGGFSVIESCATHVSLEGQGWPGEFGIFEDRLIDDWRRVAEAIHAHDALLIPQIFHAGERANAQVSGRQAWSASGDEENNVRPATLLDIQNVIEAFARATRRALAAGADGVELHGAHGYLLCQFLSPTRNHRNDRYGGTLENRARLIREVMRACRAEVPADFIVGVRLSPEDFGATVGIDIDDAIQTATWLTEDGADFIHISLWDVFQTSKKYPDTHPLTLFRAALPQDVPLITAGHIWTVDDALQTLARGADAVALGRSAIANPDWPRQAHRPQNSPRRPPLSPEELAERGLGPAFIDYMRRWQGFVR
ncbi:oxidoreductase [Lujinxingia litoralis]|uniref:Oxidoreductase n=1 Tax=Lujinxingia litoralis TaxID=2211119 RepID=A0A328CAL8_9DELT|nr:NADH:flavin oxidoreductase [Lujinxingia litoralis]RAL25182.1 oxidoreductase [Lujinxingia litoralis]